MRVGAVDYVGPGVYGGASELLLPAGYPVAALYAPVHKADDEVYVLPLRQGGDASRISCSPAVQRAA